MNKPRTRVASLAAATLFAAAGALAQHDHDHDHAQPAAAAGQAVGQAAPPLRADVLIERDAEGRVVRHAENTDLLALKVNPLITEEDWSRIRPGIIDWQKEVDRAAIDNVDFVEQFDGGLLETLDLNDHNRMRMANEMMAQLSAMGTLTGYLSHKQLLDPEQTQANVRIVSEYQQALMNEILGTGQEESEEEKVQAAVKLSNFLYELAVEDALRAYRRMLVAAAPHAPALVEELELNDEQRGPVAQAAKAAASAGTDEARLGAMRSVMDGLTLHQQRDLLLANYERLGSYDPLTGEYDPNGRLPDLAARPVAPQPATAAPEAAQPPETAEVVHSYKTPGGVLVEDLVVGTGEEAKPSATVTIHYRGTLMDGTEFDSSHKRGEPATFPLDRLIKGWQEGIPGMKVGGKRRLTIPWALAYGERGSPPAIPPRADLVFEIELLGVQNR